MCLGEIYNQMLLELSVIQIVGEFDWFNKYTEQENRRKCMEYKQLGRNNSIRQDNASRSHLTEVLNK